MLLVLMYHRIAQPELPQAAKLFQQHLAELSQHYPIVIPGEPLAKNQLSICLTFDDAYFDFYHTVYPVLRQLKLRAVLAVPVKFIMEQTTLSPTERLQVPHAQMMIDGGYQTSTPFCTWQEIQEMAASGHVVIASHSYNHLNLNQKGYDFQQEIAISRQILAAKTAQPITTFVYPFGKMNKDLHRQLREYYPYAMRIGSALNRDWENGGSGLIYRIDADPFWQQQIQWGRQHYWKYKMKYFSNLIRSR
jgi:peptidoglycan/xylan/chitin deacetylase (PgdA/CDA1 family)